MDVLFGIPTARLALLLSLLTALVLAAVALLGLRRRMLLRLGARNAVRRPLRSLIIVIGLALSTVVIATAFSTGDAMALTLRSLIAGNLGHVDEVILNGQLNLRQMAGQRLADAATGSTTATRNSAYFPIAESARLQREVQASRAIVGLIPAILEHVSAADGEAQQARANVGLLAVPATGTPGVEPLRDRSGEQQLLTALGPTEVYVNDAAAQALATGANRLLRVYLPAPATQAAATTSRTATTVEADFTVAAVVQNGALGGSQPTVFLPLEQLQQRLGHNGQINQILVINRGGGGSVAYSRQAATDLRRVLVDRNSAERALTLLSSTAGQGELAFVQRRLSGQRRALIADLARTAAQGRVTDHLLYLLGDPQVSAVLYTASYSLPASYGSDRQALRRLNRLNVIEVKQNSLDQANDYAGVLTSVFIVLGLFSVAASVLLVFLLFVMLAAERRAEMGMARAVGLRRSHLVQTFTLEGIVYDLAAALLGVLLGVAVSGVIVTIIAQTMAGYGLSVERRIEPRSLVIAFCLGTLVTFATMIVSAWRVSRVNIVEAIHGLPVGRGLSDGGPRRRGVRRLLRLPGLLAGRGLVPALAGYLLMVLGQDRQEYVLFALGVSLLIGGCALLLRWLLARLQLPSVDRLVCSLAGPALILFWSLPPSFFDRSGRRLLFGGIETFGLAGGMLVLGAVLIVSYNLSGPLQFLLRRAGRGVLAPAVKMAVAYPLQHRFRTGVAVMMFSLVIFTMIVAAVLLYSARLAYIARQQPPTGYDIRVSVPSSSPPPDIAAALAAATSIRPTDFSGVGSQAPITAQAIEPDSGYASWQPLTVHLADEGLVKGTPLQLSARARGYTSDAAVWQALAREPGTALIARGSLPSSPSTRGGLSRPLAGESGFAPVSIWLRDSNGSLPLRLTIIGVVNDRSVIPSGLLSLRANVPLPAAVQAQPSSYLFKTRPGLDPAQADVGLSLALSPLGATTHVVGEGLRTLDNVGQLLNFVLEGFVGLGLVAGMAALAVISTRSVVERRQQIGMLRAIGMQRRLVQLSFMLEASFTAWLGIGIGILAGLLLAHNVVDFLSTTVPELTFAIPWGEVALITALAYTASLASTLIAAWQAGRIHPAEALRYE